MKKAVFTCAALLAAAAITAPPTDAQVCLDFVVFCDGLELYIDGDEISGYWKNVDCKGSDVPVWGIVEEGLPLPCSPGTTWQLDPQNQAKAGVACLPELDCFVFGWEWYFLLDGLDGTLDEGVTQGGLDPPGACGLDELSYDLLLGPCPFGPEGGGIPSTSAIR